MWLGVVLIRHVFTRTLQASWISVPVIVYSDKFIMDDFFKYCFLTFSCSSETPFIPIWRLWNASHGSLVWLFTCFQTLPTFCCFVAVSCFTSWNSLVFCSASVILLFRATNGFFNITYSLLHFCHF